MYLMLPLTKVHLSNVATIYCQIGWPIRAIMYLYIYIQIIHPHSVVRTVEPQTLRLPMGQTML